MARKKKDPSVYEASQPAEGTPGSEVNLDADVPPEMQDVQKSWSRRPDPFPIETIRWQEGYAISLKESDSNREIYIQFGTGAKTDQPKNFEVIRKMLKEEYSMHWDPAVLGWAKGIRPGVTPLIKEENRDVRAAVEEAFYKAVAMEEAVRGPSLTEHARQRSSMAL